MSEKNSNDNNEVLISEVNDKIIYTSEKEKQFFDNALATYDPKNKAYTAYLEFLGSPNEVSQSTLDNLGKNPQTNLDDTQSINNIIRQYVNTDDLIGMVVQSITNNINTDFRLSYKCKSDTKKQSKLLSKSQMIIQDFNDQINIDKLIRDAIELTYTEGTYICYIRQNKDNWVLDYYPIGVAEISGYTQNGRPVVLLNMDNLKTALEKTMLKNKKGQYVFFKNVEDEIKNSYPPEVYQAYKNKDTYAVLNVDNTGVIRINNRSRKYGLSPIFRALSPTIMLKTFQETDTVNAKAKSKKIIHQILRQQDKKGLDDMAFAHTELVKACSQNTVLYTSCPAVEKVVYVEPKTDDISVDKVNLYRNKVLSSLGVAFLANDKSQTASTANINLKQLLQCINSISKQVERMLKDFYRTVLTANNVSYEYIPDITIIDAELLETDMKMELSKLLYTTFNCSRQTCLETIGLDLEDEKSKREQENSEGYDNIFTPYGTSYTKSANESDNVGRPSDDNSNNPDKQLNDKTYNKTRE